MVPNCLNLCYLIFIPLPPVLWAMSALDFWRVHPSVQVLVSRWRHSPTSLPSSSSCVIVPVVLRLSGLRCLCMVILLLYLCVFLIVRSQLYVVCSAISVELYYIFATLWGREQFTLYGILFVVYIILLSVTACVAVALTYFQLSGEDHRWWWRSIFSAGSVILFRWRILKLNYYYTILTASFPGQPG